MCRTAFVALLLVLSASAARADKLVLVAGGGDGADSTEATKAKLIQPFGVDFSAGGGIFIVEMAKGERLRSISGNGKLITFAGTGEKGDTGDGEDARKATFNGMHSLVVTPDGILYAADTWNNRVRKIDTKTGKITAFAGTTKKASTGDGGPAVQADLGGIYCVAFNADHSKLYLTDRIFAKSTMWT